MQKMIEPKFNSQKFTQLNQKFTQSNEINSDEINSDEISFNPNGIWHRFSEEKGAVLVVGHGTRKASGAAQLLDLVSQMQKLAPAAIVVGSFLELAEPSISHAIRSLHARGIERIVVVPVLLFTAAHARQDIPEAVGEAATACGLELVGQSGSLGTHSSVLALSASRFDEVIALERGATCPQNACAKVKCSSGICESRGQVFGSIGLAMVGRGTSDLAALAHMRQLTQLRVAEMDAKRFETGFFAGGEPDVDTLLEQAARWDCDTIIVQPHLLFEGELIEQLRGKVYEMQQDHPDRRWLIARTLGADPKLAEVFLELAAEQILKSA
jgi:sirohydrochlorin cobaltochelatase